MLGVMAVNSLLDDSTGVSTGVERLRGADALARVAPEWERLAGPASEPMQSPQWALAAAHHFHPGAELLTIVARRDGALVAVISLVEIRAGVRRYEIPGALALGEPLRPVVADDAARATLVAALLALRRPLSLPRIEDPGFVSLLRAGARGRALALCNAGGISLVAGHTSPGSWLERCSDSRRRVLRRNRRSLERAGALRFETLMPTAEESEASLRAAFEVEARSWKGEAGSAVLSRPAMFGFFRDFGRDCATARRLLVRRLFVGDRVAAAQVAVVMGGRCFDLKIGYDREFARHSPGLTLTCEALAEGDKSGLAAHEFLGLAEDWQRAFATHERRSESLTILPLNAPGMAAFGIDAAGALLRRARRLLGIR